VRNAFRLERALPTLRYLSEQGAKVVVVAHIGRETTDTLRPVYEAFTRLIPMQWGGVLGSEEQRTVHSALQPGEIMLLENLRQDERETANDPALASELAALASVYVNDAFDNIHREHASMVGVPTLLPSYAGLTLAEELRELRKTMQPESPSLFILGGAKFETKLPLIEKYLALYDHVFVGGALLNDILLAQGHAVGQSLVSPVSLKDAAFLHDPKLIQAVDVVVKRAGVRVVVAKEAVEADDVIVDIGPATVAAIAPYVAAAKTILWNGPMGLYEGEPDGGTQALARAIAVAPGYSVLGGGDTIAAIEPLGLLEQFGFVSIGGGAMLTYLEHGTTPALEALG
jgi:phosphoglycerate kinase